MRWLCGVSCVLLALGCGISGDPKSEAAPAGGAWSPPSRKSADSRKPKPSANTGSSRSKNGDGWNEDNPLRGLRFKGAFNSAGTSVQPKFCIGGTDATGKRMIMMLYARLDAPEEGGWLVAHSLDGNFPDGPGDTLIVDMSNPQSPGQPEFGDCGQARIEDGGVVTDIPRWDGTLSLDCRALKTTGTVRFEGCAFADVQQMPTAAATNVVNLQGVYEAVLRR